MGSTALGQIILVVSSPLLTRLYTPDDFGVLAVFASLIAIFGFISTLRYQMAIPLPATDNDAAQVIKLNILILAFFTTLSALVVYLLKTEISALLNTPDIEPYLFLLPAGFLTTGLYQTLYYWGIRKRQIKTISKTKIIQPLATTTIQVFAFPFGVAALLIARTIGPLVGSIFFIPKLIKIKNSNPNTQSISSLAIRYNRFPLFLAPADFIGQVGKQSPPLLLATFFSPAAAGAYLLAERVVMMPSKVVGKSVSDAFFGNAAQKSTKNELKKPIEKTYTTLFSIAAPPAILAVAHSPFAFSLVFGQDWHSSGEIVRVLMPLIFIMFITSPLGSLFSILERQDVGAKFHTTATAARVLGISAGAYYDDLILALTIMSAATSITYIALLLWIFKTVEINLKKILRKNGTSAIFSIIITSPLIIVTLPPSNFSLLLLALIITGAGFALYYKSIYIEINT